MLIVRFMGGLGNQLFQYAFLEYLKLNNQDVYADISDFRFHSHHYGYEIEKVFGCEIKKAEKRQIYALSINHNNFLIKVMEKIFGMKLCKNSEFNESRVPLDIRRVPIQLDMYFSGWWQNAYYINMTQTILKEKLIFRESLQGKNLECYMRFKYMDTVSVHIRRKDYLQHKNLGGICEKQYYDKAIRYMKSKLAKPLFLFFSDDIEWCKNNFGRECENCYVDWNIGENSYKDMQLMSLCKNNIIANSTFSWWGAWLNQNHEKIVIMPRQWAKISNSETLVMQGWFRM